MVTVEDVRQVALSLPRTIERLVRDRVKFNVGQIVYIAFSRDEQTMGFAFPREERAALIAAAPEKFFMPIPSEERYRWVESRMAALDPDEMRELVVDAWRMVVPKKVAAEYDGTHQGDSAVVDQVPESERSGGSSGIGDPSATP